VAPSARRSALWSWRKMGPSWADQRWLNANYDWMASEVYE
jgi:hypothetical protein